MTKPADEAEVVALVRSGPSDPGHPPDDPAEVAAVVAALTVLTGGGDEQGGSQATPRWRFSGRWWSKPQPARRDRP